MPKVAPEITAADAETVQYNKTRYPQHTPDKWAYSDLEIDKIYCDTPINGYFFLRALREFTVFSMVKFYHGGHGGYTENTERKSA